MIINYYQKNFITNKLLSFFAKKNITLKKSHKIFDIINKLLQFHKLKRNENNKKN
jgi:hypothetical protein